jgi:hypothetical protein
MKKILILSALFAVISLPVHAGEGNLQIQETDSQIIVEYSGGPEDVKAAKAQEEEREIQRTTEQEEIKKKDDEEQRHQERMERARRKGAAKGVVFEE